MKKLLFVFTSILFISGITLQAQNVLKFKSFDFYKGVVSVDNGTYDSFTFAIKIKKNKMGKKPESGIDVALVLVNGNTAEYDITDQWGGFRMYTVKVPKNARLIVGEQFEVAINFIANGFLMGTTSDTKGDDMGDGGPGGGGDPTVIIIKYP